MIGALPTSIEVNGNEYSIRTDYRDVLRVIAALDDEELDESEKLMVALYNIYEDYEAIPESDMKEAIDKLLLFINGGNKPDEDRKSKKPIFSWDQDEQMIFSGINLKAGQEVRAVPYMHWWTFIGYFHEVNEGQFADILNIRYKVQNHQKLEKYEKKFYEENKKLINLQCSKSVQKEKDRINAILNGDK